MNYGYARVSTKGQNLDRQLVELVHFGVEEKNIFKDKESGKDFNRKNYLKLRSKLKAGDLLVVKSIDRLGRNYDMIIKEWYYITKTAACDIKVLDMDLLDTRADNNLLGRFISDVVLQILSFVAENERTYLHKRQEEGIKIAKQKGIKFGRPAFTLDRKIQNLFACYDADKISLEEMLARLHISRSTFYKYYQVYKGLSAHYF